VGIIDLTIKYALPLWIGFKVTLLVSIISNILGFAFGVIICGMTMSKNKIIYSLARIYVEIIRGTPELLQIAMVYYGLPLIGIQLPAIQMGGFTSDRFISAFLALMINSSAYISEIIRAGIQSVDKGQNEAALSLGFTKFQALKLVVFPAAIKNIIPALGNNFIVLIKASAMVSTIGLADLMYTANVIRGNSFQPFSPLLIVAIMYLILTVSLSILIRRFEKYFNKNDNV
jgi:arginine/lysine/histidine transport system permease protein